MSYFISTASRNTSIVHRIVAELFIPNPENKPQVNHINGIKSDNRAENLEWATRSENMRHAVKNGLQKSGEAAYNAKLTAEQVLYIRENPDNLTCRELAQKFSVDPTIISEVQLGKIWQSVGGQIRKSRCPRLSENQKEEIRTLHKTGEYTRFQLSKMFNVSHRKIDDIIRGK